MGRKERCEGHDGIVFGSDDEGRDGNAIGYAQGAGALVILGGVGIAAAGRGDGVVKFAHGAHAGEAIELETAGKEAGLAAHAGLQGANEMPLVKPILVALDGVDAGGEIKRGTDGADAAKLRRGSVAQFAGHLQDEIAAHGVAGEEDLRQRVLLDELEENGAEVGAQAGIVERGREPFGAAAIALVDAEHAEAGGESGGRQAAHVAGFAGAFEAMHGDQSGGLARIALPMAARQQARSGFDFEEAVARVRQRRGAAGEQCARERHEVSVPK